MQRKVKSRHHKNWKLTSIHHMATVKNLDKDRFAIPSALLAFLIEVGTAVVPLVAMTVALAWKPTLVGDASHLCAGVLVWGWRTWSRWRRRRRRWCRTPICNPLLVGCTSASRQLDRLSGSSRSQTISLFGQPSGSCIPVEVFVIRLKMGICFVEEGNRTIAPEVFPTKVGIGAELHKAVLLIIQEVLACSMRTGSSLQGRLIVCPCAVDTQAAIL